MFIGVNHTRSGLPVPLDSSGREMCLLFIKYGRCRFKNKCKKSHWVPPLPDEEYPKLPPLPPYPHPSSSDIDISSKRQVTSHDIFMADGQRQNFPGAFEANCNPKKYTAHCGIGNNSRIPRGNRQSNSQDFFDTCQTLNQERQEFCNLHQTMEVPHFLINQHHPGNIQNYNTLELSTTSATMVRVCPSVPDLKDDVGMNLEKETEGLKDVDPGFATVDSKVTMEAMETSLDRLSRIIYQRKNRFDFVYHPNTQAKGVGWKYKSNIDQSYQQYGAYFDHAKKKLEFQHQPRDKVEKKNFKLLRKAHWNTCQDLKAKLAQLPPGYSLKVDFTRVNFSRLRPYFYLLVHQCFYCADPTNKHWKPSPFSCVVAETLIAFFATGKTTAAEAERRMQDWGARPVRVRQCISHMWNIIVKSSLSTSGVAQDVLDCEKQVFAKKVSAVDYAYACTLAGPLVKGNTIRPANISAPAIIKSVRQGIQAANYKKASLLQTKTTKLKPSTIVGNVSSRTNGGTIKKVSRTLAYGAIKATGVRWKKKKTKRSQQFSFLDEQRKRELLKRCRTILEEEHT